MATEPKQTEVTVSYSAGVKCNLGHDTYENANFSVTRSEKYDVSDLSSEEVEEFWQERFTALREQLDTLIEEIHRETSGILDD